MEKSVECRCVVRDGSLLGTGKCVNETLKIQIKNQQLRCLLWHHIH